MSVALVLLQESPNIAFHRHAHMSSVQCSSSSASSAQYQVSTPAITRQMRDRESVSRWDRKTVQDLLSEAIVAQQSTLALLPRVSAMYFSYCFSLTPATPRCCLDASFPLVSTPIACNWQVSSYEASGYMTSLRLTPSSSRIGCSSCKYSSYWPLFSTFALMPVCH